MPLVSAIPAIIGGVGSALGGLFGGGGGDSGDSGDSEGGGGILSGIGNFLGSKGFQNIAGLGGGVTGAILQSQALGKYLELLKQQAAINQGYATTGVDQAKAAQQPAKNTLLSILGQGGYNNVGQINNYLQQLQKLQTNLPSQYIDALKVRGTEAGNQMAHIADQLNWVAGRQNNAQNWASQIADNGGWSPQSSSVFDAFMNMGGGGNPMQSLLGSSAGQMLGAGGFTPALQSGINSAADIVARGGTSPNTGAGIQSALGLLQHPYTMPIQKPDTLSLNEAANIARNQAATANAQQARNARAQAVSLGGGPGATVANGATNSALADFADKAAQNESGAMQTALLNQQGINANTSLQTQGLKLQALQQALQQMQTGGGLLQGMTGTDLQRQLGALNVIGSLTGAATQRAGVGGSLAGSNLQSQLSGLSGAMSPISQSSQNTFNALNSINQIGQLQGNLFNQAGQNYLGGANLQLGAANSQFGNLLQALLPMLQTAQTGTGNMLSGASLLNSQANPWLQLAGGALGTNPAYFGTSFAQSPFGNFLTGLGGH